MVPPTHSDMYPGCLSQLAIEIENVCRTDAKNKSWKEGLAIWPFAIFAGLAFTVPYALTGIFLGPDWWGSSDEVAAECSIGAD